MKVIDNEMRNKVNNFVNMILLYENWVEIMLDYIGINTKKKMLIKLRNGLKFWVEDVVKEPWKSTKMIGNEIFIRNAYTPKGFEIDDGDTVVDVGAYIGVFSIFASSQGANVYSYEPNPDSFHLLKKNIKLNNIKRIKAYNKAVCGKDGNTDLFRNKKFPQLTTTTITDGEKIKVNCTSLKEIIKNIGFIDLLKMDCEGAEYEILQQLPEEFLSQIKKISMEYHEFKDYKKDDIKKFLEENGFIVRLTSIREDSGLLHAIKMKI